MNRFIQPKQWAKLARKNGFSGNRQNFTLALLLTGLLTFITFPVLALSSASHQQQGTAGVLTQIEVDAFDTGQSGVPITSEAITLIKETENVYDVRLNARIGIYTASEGSWSSNAVTANLANLPPDISIQDVKNLPPNGVIAPSEIEGVNLKELEGKTTTFAYTKMTGQGTGTLANIDVVVTKTYDAKWENYGPGAFIAHEDLVTKLLAEKSGVTTDEYLNSVGVPSLIVTVDDIENVNKVAKEIRALGYPVVAVKDSLSFIPDLIKWIPGLVALSGLLCLILLVVSCVLQMRSTMKNRMLEFGLLRAKGWSTLDIRKLLAREISHAILLGSIMGTIIGALIGLMTMQKIIPQGLSVPYLKSIIIFCILIAFITITCLTIVYCLTKRMLKTDPFLTVTRQT